MKENNKKELVVEDVVETPEDLDNPEDLDPVEDSFVRPESKPTEEDELRQKYGKIVYKKITKDYVKVRDLPPSSDGTPGKPIFILEPGVEMIVSIVDKEWYEVVDCDNKAIVGGVILKEFLKNQ